MMSEVDKFLKKSARGQGAAGGGRETGYSTNRFPL